MSGHSKWSTIKRQKGANDMKRGQTFTKLSNVITVAVKQGGGIGDPESNFKLRLAIDAARTANMPKENIERAIQRALGKDAANMEEVMYEGFGPQGISVIVEALTDNKNRTTPEVKSIFDKGGGNMGQPGSVSYLFKQIGVILVQKNGQTFDDIMLLAADAGAEDAEDGSDEVYIFTQVQDLAKVRSLLAEKGLKVVEAEISRKPIVPKVIEEEKDLQQIDAFVERLENLEDVQKVYTNVLSND